MDKLVEPFERFSIMTVDGGLSDEKALKIIEDKFGIKAVAGILKILNRSKK